jgi:hypothetical protein
MNKSFSVGIALVLLSVMLVATPPPVRAPSKIVYIELQPKPFASFMVDGVEYWFWVAAVTASPYGTGNMVIIFKSVSVNAYNFSVYVAPENLLLGEKYGWLTLQVYPVCVPNYNMTFEGVQSASITTEETATNLTATVSGPISLSITYAPYGDSSTFIEDPGDSPHLDDHDGDGFWSYSTRGACTANGSFNGYQLGPTNLNWGDFDIIDYEWYDLGKLPTYDVNKDRIVNIQDVVIAALAFGSAAQDDPNTPWNETRNWNVFADLNCNGKVNIFDLVIIAVNFGKTW